MAEDDIALLIFLPLFLSAEITGLGRRAPVLCGAET